MWYTKHGNFSRSLLGTFNLNRSILAMSSCALGLLIGVGGMYYLVVQPQRQMYAIREIFFKKEFSSKAQDSCRDGEKLDFSRHTTTYAGERDDFSTTRSFSGSSGDERYSSQQSSFGR